MVRLLLKKAKCLVLGVIMLRKDLVYEEGFIASSNLLDNQQED
jgi:hypothetical protein